MKIMNPDNIEPEELTAAIFTGAVTRQILLASGESRFFNMSVVNFPKGVRNKLHSHDSEQILMITKGRGIIASSEEERIVSAGDVIAVRPGEQHWHGATDDSDFSHITVTQAGSKTTQLED